MENADPPFTFRAAQVFVAAVEAQSVTRAAHRLGMAASSVSQQLSTLEAALGAKLIERSARQFRLTRAGEVFLPAAKALLDDVSAVKAQLVMADQAPPMAVHVASIEELDATVCAPWLLRLKVRFPNISVTLSSGASHENHDALSSRAVDLMMAVDTVAEVDWVEQHPILRDPFVLVTAPGLAPEAILSRPFVRYAGDLQIGRQIEAQLRRSGVSPPRGFEFSTNQALFAMTSELGGWAVTTALAFLGTPLAGNLVRAHPLPVPAFSRRLALHARAGALGGLPAQMAGDMRACLGDRILQDAQTRLPFLGDGLQVLR
ncbi:LysR family transcriptional regulator [Pseudooctadecabacter jejudonensis]|uniref:HTH-type transcriptional regulator YofA n=1 Tax=Pseudooctadecabacter jejudonensis TaxID=1391910 RepID=A0A1Y5T5U1_9RHOB|nr:LysR family transcriptional regulator [Pseudooctadecabacter jejudonensis]SLN56488.1 HTH-type transcriptional regulator YofA [Pseudooctadecabacter jejudonensis]